ncbi:MAG: UDP-2,3-diacylglucosamine diphosphatase [Bdellovibrionaceae bacterium]|nr:UDP-2,3-diacylglucosamine diphosphatase [Pseudobdellovibrionaceae bacterium]
MSVCYFLSDLHLKGRSDKNYEKLIHFFEVTWQSKPGDVILLGDIFDLWVADHSLFISEYKELIEYLKKTKSKNYRVLYFEGNHDLHLDKFWSQTLGFEVIPDLTFIRWDNLVFRLEHGDLINQEDKAYLKLRKFLRSPIMTWLAFVLPGFFWNYLGKKWSSASRKKSQIYSAEKISWIRDLIRQHAQKQIETQYFDVIVTGHMHVRDEFHFLFQGKNITSYNLGSWQEEQKILVYQQSSPNFSWLDLNII